EAYQAEFRSLRDGDIERYLNDRPAGFGAGGRSVEEVRARVKERKRILDRIERLERTLFDQVASSLDAEFAMDIDRARREAEMARWRRVIGQSSVPGGRFDLAATVREF